MRKFALLATLVLIMVFIVTTYLHDAQETNATGDGVTVSPTTIAQILEMLKAEAKATPTSPTPTPPIP